MEHPVTRIIDPEPVGMSRAALATAIRLASSRPGTGRLTVARHGHLVLDHRWGPHEGDLHWVFSAAKPVVAVLIHQLADDGALVLDDPVAAHWPEFGEGGKESVTVRHVLTHRAAMPTARGVLRGGALADARVMGDWEVSVGRVASGRLRGKPGRFPAYGYLGFGFILGEVVQRVTGEPFAEVSRQRVFEPLGMESSWFGVPRREAGRLIPLTGHGPISKSVARVTNSVRVAGAVIPAGGLTTTTLDLLRFYEALRRGGELDGTRILSEESVAALAEPSDQGQRDRFVNLNVRYGQGVQRGGPREDILGWGPFGRHSLPTTFGHNGSNVAIAWTDPVRGLSYAHVTGYQSSYLRDFTHLAKVADAVLASCGREV
nr:beta-lactamase family protein [Actinomycetales bacterium]